MMASSSVLITFSDVLRADRNFVVEKTRLILRSTADSHTCQFPSHPPDLVTMASAAATKAMEPLTMYIVVRKDLSKVRVKFIT